MKKIWLAAALAAIGVMATSVYADVQNIRLSGDVRVRGYYVNASNDQKDNSFILQRTRVTCEADLEDHVLLVITLKADGQWGKESKVSYAQSSYDRGWEVGIVEAYVQFSEMFFTPATLKLGRQYLNYGKGFVLSSANETYNFDAGRLVLDFYPFTLDIVGAKIADKSGVSAYGGHGGNDLLFVNARYEMKDSILKDVEAYFGWCTPGSSGGVSAYYPTYGAGYQYPGGGYGTYNCSPWIAGVRTDLTPMKGLQVWAEGAFEGGTRGDGQSLEAWMANVGAKYTMKDMKMEPAINVNYIYASGGGSGYADSFIPFFPSFDGYNGYLFCPLISNIHIFNVGASIKPAKNVTLSAQAYYYLKADNDSWAGTDTKQQDFGGLQWMTWNSYNDKRELGWEFDGICGYDYSKDARFQLVYAAFLPDRSYQAAGLSAVAHMVRAEVNVKF